MTNKQAYDYWRYRYEAAKDYRDEHWDAEERHAHQEYIEAMKKAIYALETVYELKKMELTDEEITRTIKMAFKIMDKWNKRGDDERQR